MFQIDLLSHSLPKYHQFPQREPIRRNYQTCRINRTIEQTNPIDFKPENKIKIPLNLSKLYQKKSKNIIIRQSQSLNNPPKVKWPIVIMKTVNGRRLQTECNKPKEVNSLSSQDNNGKANSFTKINFNAYIQQQNAYDSSSSSDFRELRRTFFIKYGNNRAKQSIERKPKFQIHSQQYETLDPWIAD